MTIAESGVACSLPGDTLTIFTGLPPCVMVARVDNSIPLGMDTKRMGTIFAPEVMANNEPLELTSEETEHDDEDDTMVTICETGFATDATGAQDLDAVVVVAVEANVWLLLVAAEYASAALTFTSAIGSLTA